MDDPQLRIRKAVERAKLAGHGIKDSDCYHPGCLACMMVDDLRGD